MLPHPDQRDHRLPRQPGQPNPKLTLTVTVSNPNPKASASPCPSPNPNPNQVDRVKLRSEFIRLSLLDVLQQLHREKHVDVVRQVGAFELGLGLGLGFGCLRGAIGAG